MDDKEIIDLFLTRNERAIEETDSRYGAFSRNLSYHILNSHEDVEECVNDAYLKLWDTIPPTVPDSLKAYLGRIVRNLSLNRLRWKKEQKRDCDVKCSAVGDFRLYGNYYYTKNSGAAPKDLYTVGGVMYFFRKGMAVTDEYIYHQTFLYHADSKGVLTKVKENGLFYEDANRLYFVYVENNKLVKGWKKIDGHYYYFDPYARRGGNEKIDGKRYYFNTDGILETDGWIRDFRGFSVYYASESGELLTGHQKIDGKWYYFGDTGRMQTGIVETETGTCIYGKDGVYRTKVKKGWNQADGEWYYYDGEAFVKYQTITIGNQSYYLDGDGKMVRDGIRSIVTRDPDTKRLRIGEIKLFDSDGRMVNTPGWHGKYYVDPDTGNALCNVEKEIVGKLYIFDVNGMVQTKDFLDTSDRTLSKIASTGEYYEKSARRITIASTGEVTSVKDMPDGWLLYGGSWYYYKNGIPVNGWVGKYYVKAGVMLRNTNTPDGYWVGQNGAYQKAAGWVLVNHEQKNGMYVKSGGSLARNEWLLLGTKWYYFRDYNLVTGAQRINGTWYIFDDNGILQSCIGKKLKDGWKKAGKYWYYFKGGALVNGSLTIGGKEYTFEDSRMIGGPGFENVWYSKYNSPKDDGQYYVKANGQALKAVGWKQIDGNWFYFGKNCKIFSDAWVRVDQKTYYQRVDGIVTGVQLIDGSLYRFDENGVLLKMYTYDEGWHKIEGKWYYFREGNPVTSEVIAYGGKNYLLRADGALACNELVGDSETSYGRHYADKNGVVVHDQLIMIDGHPHYFGSDGRELFGVRKINGKTYYLDY